MAKCTNCGMKVDPMPYCGRCGGKTDADLDDCVNFMSGMMRESMNAEREGFIEIRVSGDEYLWATPTDPCDDSCDTFRVCFHDAICGSGIKEGDILRAKSEGLDDCPRLYICTEIVSRESWND